MRMMIGDVSIVHGMEIGMYRHDNVEMQNNGQLVWILHIELSAAERPMVNPLSPGAYRAYAND